TCSTSAYTAFRRCYLGCVCTFLTLYLRIPSFLFVLPPRPPPSTLFPYTTLFRSYPVRVGEQLLPPQVNQESNVVHAAGCPRHRRSEEHTSELQSRFDLVCRLRLEKQKHRPGRSQMWHIPNISVRRASHRCLRSRG